MGALRGEFGVCGRVWERSGACSRCTFSLVSVAASTTLYQSPATLGGLNSPPLNGITASLVPSPFFVAGMVTGRPSGTPLSSAACIFRAGFVAVQS